MVFGTAKRHSDLLLVVAWLAAAGCDSPKSSGASVDGGDEEPGRDGSTSEPEDPTELPGGYVPHIECGALGNTCDVKHPCPDEFICQGGVCLPDLEDTQVASCAEDACPGDAPICAIGVCVTVDQLACVCLDLNGRERVYQCASVAEHKVDAGAQCLPEDSLCDTVPDACCEGMSCLRGKDAEDKPLLGLCKQGCENDGDCDTQCCTETEGLAGKHCADFSVCLGACRELDEECDGARNPCCEGLVCAQSSTDVGLNGCQKPCTKNSECDTDCCVLFQGAGGVPADNGVCAPQDRCAGQ